MSCLPFDPSLYGEGIEDDYDDEPDNFRLVVEPEDLVGAFEEPFGASLGYQMDGQHSIFSADPAYDDLDLEESKRQARIAAGIEHQCAHCGCSESRACPGGCVWATPTLCSRCVTS